MNHARRHLRPAKPAAFTLIELMVVIGIIVVLAAVSIPAIKSLTNNNAQSQAVNQIRAMLAYARSLALSQHREAGVVFYEQTGYGRQTAMQVFVEDYNQAQYYPPYTNGITDPNTTVYVQSSADTHFLPPGIMVASLSTDETGGTGNATFNTNQSTGGYKTRAVVFDSTGHLELRGQLATPNPGANDHYADWNFALPNYTPTAGQVGAASSGAFVIFNQTDYNNANLGNETNRAAWLQQHADMVVINPYTGTPIR